MTPPQKNPKLSEQQIAVLRVGAVSGMCVNGGWQWSRHDGASHINVTRTIRRLLKSGLLNDMYFIGGKASASITDAGRQALIEATTGRVRLDKAVEQMAAR